jgi:hypothetical protein
MVPQFKALAETKHKYFEKIKSNPSLKPPPLEFNKPSVVSQTLAPFGGAEGCGVQLAAVMSGMQLYDLDVDPEERFAFCFLCFFLKLCLFLHIYLYLIILKTKK